MSGSQTTSVPVEISHELVAAVWGVAEKRRPLMSTIGLEVDEVVTPTLEDLTGSALVVMALLTTFEASGQTHLLKPLADGSLISFADIAERAEALNTQLCSGQPEPVELRLPARTAASLEVAARASGMTVGEIVCSSLVDYLAVGELMEERGGPLTDG